MLLNDLLKLFSTNFDINEQRLVEIIESNNIKLSQRLLLEIKADKKINTNSTTNPSTNPNINPSIKINDTLNTNVVNNDDSNAETDSKKKETSVRGRGRPRKTKDIKEESSVLLEVEVVVLGSKEYYKTRENVLLNKELEIEGIYVDGKISKRGVGIN
jgi:hypothetical protein